MLGGGSGMGKGSMWLKHREWDGSDKKKQQKWDSWSDHREFAFPLSEIRLSKKILS